MNNLFYNDVLGTIYLCLCVEMMLVSSEASQVPGRRAEGDPVADLRAGEPCSYGLNVRGGTSRERPRGVQVYPGAGGNRVAAHALTGEAKTQFESLTLCVGM